MEVELKVLIECLRKKELALKQIASITVNQGDLITSNLNHEEIYSIFMQMNTEKQQFIDRVLQCDEVFENMFRTIGPALDADPAKYGEEVKTMQNLIRSVMDLDVQIRVNEDTNGHNLTERLVQYRDKLALDEKGEKPETIDSGEYGSQKVLDAYRSHSRNRR